MKELTIHCVAVNTSHLFASHCRSPNAEKTSKLKYKQNYSRKKGPL